MVLQQVHDSLPPKAEAAASGPAALDLCAGCGGMGIGLENAGFKIVFANETNEDAAETYCHNFPHVPMVTRDIRKLQPPHLKRKFNVDTVDIIFAQPCQK